MKGLLCLKLINLVVNYTSHSSEPLPYQPHHCSHCGNDIEQFFRHGLSCWFSLGILAPRNTLNSIQHACPHSCKNPLSARAFQITPSRWEAPWWDDHGSLGAGKSSWYGMQCMFTLFASHTVTEQPQRQEKLLHKWKKTKPRHMHM